VDRRICFYHSADLDGKCSAAIVQRYFGAKNIELYGFDYGHQFPWEKVDGETEVIMVDLGLQPFSQMLELNRVAKSLTWIDHHKSAIDTYLAQEERWQGELQTDRAACELVWEYYHDDQPIPRAVFMLGVYDTWRWQDVSGALEFQYGMRSVENAPSGAIWDSLFCAGHEVNLVTESIISAGRNILRYTKRQNAIYAKATSSVLHWEGLTFIASNAQLTNSALFDSVYDPEQHDAMLTFGWRNNSWTISMYAPKEVCEERGFNLGALAKKHGGGGHVGAAGFQAPLLPFDLV
jgi:oligoribonuclease NrnB/cAMP/cGMP phosphodiesterase (DHH superfamily)